MSLSREIMNYLRASLSMEETATEREGVKAKKVSKRVNEWGAGGCRGSR